MFSKACFVPSFKLDMCQHPHTDSWASASKKALAKVGWHGGKGLDMVGEDVLGTFHGGGSVSGGWARRCASQWAGQGWEGVELAFGTKASN